jgi:hypothetical protein
MKMSSHSNVTFAKVVLDERADWIYTLGLSMKKQNPLDKQKMKSKDFAKHWLESFWMVLLVNEALEPTVLKMLPYLDISL